MKKHKTKWTDKLDNIMTCGELNTLQDLIIFQEQDGSYHLFNKYIIQKAPAHQYEVTSDASYLFQSFSSLKNATAWCIFDKREKFYETQRITELDAKLGSVEFDLARHQTMYRKAKTTDEQLIYVAKLNEDKMKRKLIVAELEVYTVDSMKWQTKRFDQKPV